MRDLIIVGSGGLGRETAWMVERINASGLKWNTLGYIDDNPATRGMEFDGYKVLGGCDIVSGYRNAYFVIAIGNTMVREKVVEKIGRFANVKYATLIDPDSIIDKNRVNIGDGAIICANTYITVDINIGKHVYIGANSTVGHDTVIDDYVTLYPGVNVSGSTHLSKGCELGTGTKIIQGLSVGKDTIVGAGSVIVRDLPSDCTAVGVPAKPIKIRNIHI